VKTRPGWSNREGRGKNGQEKKSSSGGEKKHTGTKKLIGEGGGPASGCATVKEERGWGPQKTPLRLQKYLGDEEEERAGGGFCGKLSIP